MNINKSPSLIITSYSPVQNFILAHRTRAGHLIARGHNVKGKAVQIDELSINIVPCHNKPPLIIFGLSGETLFTKLTTWEAC